MSMLKITQEQQRYEIVQIEQHISNLSDLDIVEIEKQKIARLIYFAKQFLKKSASPSVGKYPTDGEMLEYNNNSQL